METTIREDGLLTVHEVAQFSRFLRLGCTNTRAKGPETEFLAFDSGSTDALRKPMFSPGLPQGGPE